MRFIAGDQAIEDNLIAYVDRGPEALKFFEDCGLQFRISKGLSDHYYDSAPGSVAEGRCLNTDFIAATDLSAWQDMILTPRDTPLEVNSEELIAWGGITNIDHWPKDIMEDRRRRKIRTRGVGVVTHYVKQLLRRSVPIFPQTRVDRLITEGERVAGVATKTGKRIGCRRGVMLACGGYESNPDLVRAYEGLPGWQSMFPPTIEGDGIVMAAEIGAQVRVIHNNMALFLGFNLPGRQPGELPLFRLVGISEMLCPDTIVVNKAGHRFADESTSSRWCRACAHTRWKATVTSICRAISCLTSNMPTVFLLPAIRKDARFRNGWRVPGRSNNWHSRLESMLLGWRRPSCASTCLPARAPMRTSGAAAPSGRSRERTNGSRRARTKPMCVRAWGRCVFPHFMVSNCIRAHSRQADS